MQENQTDLLNEDNLEINTTRRKQLLPWWIKVFMWIFLVLSAIVPVGLVFGLLGFNFQLALYGLETNEAISTIGIAVMALFLFKGITAFGMLTEKSWAIKLGLADAVVGILICIFVMLYPLMDEDTELHFVIRLELVALIPYLIKLFKIRSAWENTIPQ